MQVPQVLVKLSSAKFGPRAVHLKSGFVSALRLNCLLGFHTSRACALRLDVFGFAGFRRRNRLLASGARHHQVQWCVLLLHMRMQDFQA